MTPLLSLEHTWKKTGDLGSLMGWISHPSLSSQKTKLRKHVSEKLGKSWEAVSLIKKSLKCFSFSDVWYTLPVELLGLGQVIPGL